VTPAKRLVHFVRPYARLAIFALVMLVALVVLDLAIPRLIQRIIDEGIRKSDKSLVLHTALFMLGISAVSTVIAIANNALSVRVGEGVARDLREALFLKIQSYSFGDLDRQKTGQLLVRLTSDVSAIKSLTQISLRIGSRAPLLMLGSLALMVATSRQLALALLPLLVVTGGLIVVYVARMEPLFRRVQEGLDGVNTILQENVAGARLVKAFVRADFEAERFEAANEEMTLRSIRSLEVMSTMTPVLTTCINAGVVIVIWLGGARAVRGDLSLGQLVAFTNYLFTTMTPLVMMTLLSNTWAAGMASLRRVERIFATIPEVQDAPNATALDPHADAVVTFENVSFAYGEGERDDVLREIALTAKPGTTTAILGSTGAGKSTLVALIPRLYDPKSGFVSVAGKNVREATRDSLIARVGMVLQEAILFSGTVRDNIRYGRPDASHEEVESAAKRAQAHDFIVKMPSGYDSHVEQRGANLSGGQRQRISIARALLVDPSILILDDATSAVDVETESKIQMALAETKAKRATVVVAQRISTVLDADTILVLDRGRIVARGTHAELMRSSSLYREIYDSQLGGGPASEATT